MKNLEGAFSWRNSECLRTENMPFLVECGKNNQHKSWAYSGLTVREDDWDMSGYSRAGCAQAVAMGLVFPVAPTHRGTVAPIFFNSLEQVWSVPVPLPHEAPLSLQLKHWLLCLEMWEGRDFSC